METLYTNRLVLRPVTEADIPDIYAYSRHPQVGLNAGWKPHESIEETREIAGTVLIGQPGMAGIVLRDTGGLIGNIGLVEDGKRENGRCRMLGYAIGVDHWGRGYATEAALALLDYGFSRMGLDLVSAYCYPDNPRSRRVIEKCGMQYEGRMRMAEALFNGAVQDELCFSLTREEFLSR